jgi:hypothetical protein
MLIAGPDRRRRSYNLHVMLRFDLARAAGGTIAVADLPEAWRERASRPGRFAAGRSRRRAAGYALVWRSRRRRIPKLHARQHHERPVLRRGPA